MDERDGYILTLYVAVAVRKVPSPETKKNDYVTRLARESHRFTVYRLNLSTVMVTGSSNLNDPYETYVMFEVKLDAIFRVCFRILIFARERCRLIARNRALSRGEVEKNL